MGLPGLNRPIIDRRAHNDGVGDVLIDLGEQRGRPPRDIRAPRARPHPHRTALAVLSAVLLVGLSGAAAPPTPVAPVMLPAGLGDAMFVERDRLHVVSAGPEPRESAVQTKIVSTYTLPGGAPLSRTRVALTGTVFQVTAVGETLLVSYQVDAAGAAATVAHTAGSDRARWVAPARLLGVSPADGLVLLRENNPRYGDLDWYGLDLATGRTRWSVDQSLPRYTTEAGYTDGFPRRLVTATTAGHVEVRDTVTGATVSEGDVPVQSDWSRRGITVWSAGDLVLIGGIGGVTAYSLADLTPRWHSPLDLAGHWVQDCVDAICVFGYRGVQVLDPGTGRVRWAADSWTTATKVGPNLLFSGNEGRQGRFPLVVVEPGTGVVRGDFETWWAVGPERADGTVLGLHQGAGDVVFYALLDPATLTVRVLGAAGAVSGDCQATTDVLVCRRVDATVAIWPVSE